MKTKRKQSRRIHRGRLTLLLAVILSLLLTIGLSLGHGSANAGEALQYTVQPGDSLWTVARQYAPNTIDVRVYIQQIKQVNSLNNNLLHPGQVLLIPSR